MILGVLLAGGTGSRFDARNKLLADLDGQSIVVHSARTLTQSNLDAVIAVVGHESEQVASVLPEGVEIIENPDYEQGQSTSVRCGVEVARERGAESALFALGDMPCVAAETVDAILREYSESPDAGIVAPRYGGERGNPVLFDARYFDGLTDVTGDRGGRALLDSDPVTWVDVDDPGIHRDVDTRRDLRDLQDCLDW